MIHQEIKRLDNNKSKAALEMGISREALRKKLLASKEVVERLEGEVKSRGLPKNLKKAA